jgi:Tfp pilus assembly protein PilO
MRALSRLSPGAFMIVTALVVGAFLIEAWMLVLRQPFAAYRDFSAARESLLAIERMTASQQEELRRESARNKDLAERLRAELHAPAPEEQLTVSIMRRLDQAAAGAGIKLTSLKPAGRRNVLSFEEISFEVGAQGGYLALCHWLLGFEALIGRSATVSEFTMKAVDEGRQVSLSLRLAVYRPLPNGASAP